MPLSDHIVYPLFICAQLFRHPYDALLSLKSFGKLGKGHQTAPSPDKNTPRSWRQFETVMNNLRNHCFALCLGCIATILLTTPMQA